MIRCLLASSSGVLLLYQSYMPVKMQFVSTYMKSVKRILSPSNKYTVDVSFSVKVIWNEILKWVFKKKNTVERCSSWRDYSNYNRIIMYWSCVVAFYTVNYFRDYVYPLRIWTHNKLHDSVRCNAVSNLAEVIRIRNQVTGLSCIVELPARMPVGNELVVGTGLCNIVLVLPCHVS
jgi:hypothetical protein